MKTPTSWKVIGYNRTTGECVFSSDRMSAVLNYLTFEDATDKAQQMTERFPEDTYVVVPARVVVPGKI